MKRLRPLFLAALWVASVPAAWGQQETPFQTETRLISQALPCKWVSMGGRTGPSYGNGRFDYACKGGTWGTITLLLDADSSRSGAVQKVRLGYREWAENANPVAAEAMVAEQFLQTVLNRYVPSSVAPEVREAFWGATDGRWREGDTAIRIWRQQESAQFTQIWLEITGGQLGGGAMPVLSAPQVNLRWPAGREMPQGGGLLREANPTAAFTPATPQAPVQLPIPGQGIGPSMYKETLAVPDNAPAGPARMLEKMGMTPKDPVAPPPPMVNPATLNTAPAPESLARPKPPPVVKQDMVPTPEMLTTGRAPAPSNFEAYRKAEELTRDIEEKALGSNQQRGPKIENGSAVVAPPETQGPGLTPLPQPMQPAVPTATGGLSQPMPQPAADPRFTPNRDLPQLKFIPKAEPLDTTTDVIRFGDEQGSGF